MTDLYKTYTAFKKWGACSPPASPEEFAYITAIGQCAPSDRILEIGFGAGHFMDWARATGFQIAGIEIIPEMVQAARERGHLVFDDLHGQIEEKFDAVVALDVLEHVPHADLAQLLMRTRQLLNPRGRLIARFPNGDSPFSGRYQNGDATHLKPLSATSLSQIAITTGMRIACAINPRPLPKAPVPRLKRRAMYAARDLIEMLLGRIYFGDRFPMDPNILVVMTPS